MAASEAAVLGVIRAARPRFRSPPSSSSSHDPVAFAVHAAFLSAGFSLTAAGSRANLPVADSNGAAGLLTSSNDGAGNDENIEVGIEGWNEMDEAYAFHYSGLEQPNLCNSVFVKCIAMGDTLMVDAVPGHNDEDKEPLHLEIRVGDYVTGVQSTNYGQLYKNLNGLVDKINSKILSRLVVTKETPSTSRKEEIYREYSTEGSAIPGSVIIEEPPPSLPGLRYPPVPSIGGSDLFPGPGAGVYPSRIDPGSGGMLLGPHDPRWGIDRGYGISGFPQDGRGTIPPGARFDPFGPPGVPGFEPDRFAGTRRPPGGTHPDLEHFKPF